MVELCCVKSSLSLRTNRNVTIMMTLLHTIKDLVVCLSMRKLTRHNPTIKMRQSLLHSFWMFLEQWDVGPFQSLSYFHLIILANYMVKSKQYQLRKVEFILKFERSFLFYLSSNYYLSPFYIGMHYFPQWASSSLNRSFSILAPSLLPWPWTSYNRAHCIDKLLISIFWANSPNCWNVSSSTLLQSCISHTDVTSGKEKYYDNSAIYIQPSAE